MKTPSSNIIQTLQERFAPELEGVNQHILSHIRSDEELIEQVSSYLIEGRGKRIRPLLTIMIANLFDYNGTNHIFLAAAVEFIHAATLLHDDVVDNSLLRRFKPSANSVWGNKTSILVGDYLFSQSFNLMVQANSLKALRSLATASAVIAEGEVSQLVNMQEQKLLGRAEYFKIISAKTAELFASSSEVGAIIAGANEKQIMHSYKFGHILGQIFQIKDDWLDYASSHTELGKNIGDDYQEGKLTLPLILLFDIANAQEQEFITSILHNSSHRTAENLKTILELFGKYNIQNSISDIIETMIKDGINHLEALDIIHPTKNLLIDLINFAGARES